jgi:O-antigen ligase
MTAKVRYYQPMQETRPVLDARAMLTQAAFGLALAMTAARCMLLETIRDPFEISIGALAIPRNAGANVSLILDLLCCLPAILVLLLRCLDKTYTIRWAWSTLPMLLLAGWMAASAAWADDQFAAVVSSANFIAAIALLWAMSQLVRSWTRLRLVVAIAYGLLLVFLVKGYYYKFLDMPMLLENQTKMLQQQGFDPKSYSGILFAKKIGELMGFNSSANSFAGMIILLMTMGLGVVIQRIKDRDDPGWPLTLAIFFPLGIGLLFYTQSKAALVMPVLVLALLGVFWKWHRPIARQSKRNFWIGVGIVVTAITLVIGHGLYHHGLPTASMNFRWRYWVGSWRMFWRHPIHGVGWENFGPHYLRDRLPRASEEIRDPHNLLVRFFVELGAVGGLLAIAWQLRLWWEMTRPIVPPPTIARPVEKPNFGSILFLGGIALAAIIANTAASVDFTQSASWITVELINRFLYLCAMLIGSLAVALRSLKEPRIDDRAAPWVVYGILIALGVFLIHNLIEFSLFETGPLCLFCVLTGSVLGIRLGNPPVRTPRIAHSAQAALVLACCAWLAGAVWIAIPTALAESSAHVGDDQLRAGHCEQAGAQYDDAYRLMPLNADYAFRAGRALQFALGPPAPLTDAKQIDLAERLQKLIQTNYDLAIERNPAFGTAYRFRAILWLQTSHPLEMINDFEKVMELNPNEVSLRLEYARDLEKFQLWSKARDQLKLALAYNDKLDPPPEPKRLSQEQVNSILQEIEQSHQP